MPIVNQKGYNIARNLFVCIAISMVIPFFTPAPKFVQELPDLIEVIPGSTVRLDCRILGCPDPEIQWSKNGEILDESSRIRTEFTDKDKVSLVIDDARASDSGRYEMRARNEFGYNEMSSDVIIKGKKKIINI